MAPLNQVNIAQELTAFFQLARTVSVFWNAPGLQSRQRRVRLLQEEIGSGERAQLPLETSVGRCSSSKEICYRKEKNPLCLTLPFCSHGIPGILNVAGSVTAFYYLIKLSLMY